MSPAPDPLFTRPYVFFLSGRFCAVLASTSQAVVIAWEVYETARQTMSVAEASLVVGMIGLAKFLPLVALALVAGETADRHDRRTILRLCYAAQLVTAVGLALRSGLGGGLWQIFALAALFGCARAFFQPTVSALGPMLVPPHLLPRAIATNSLVSQVANISGPALGGVLCAVSPVAGYVVCVALYAAAVLCISLVRADTRPAFQAGRSRAAQIREGLAYVWGSKLVLGAISLDMFAVMLGGVTGLLPVFARDVLHVGPEGFGVLRGAPAIGALLMAGSLSVRPIRGRIGAKMFLAVAVFGLMTLVFAYSRSFPLSVACLAVLGAADMVSVFTRQSMVQIATPDHLRGRVSAVSTLFIGASNELGEVESGIAARFLGPVGAAAFGGYGSLAVTGLWAWLFPGLRTADRLDGAAGP
ncbi:Permease of the major facilitator superfamily OS=Phenylobacterium zucineum (strain HLK1) GN=PHZ_c2880 PE=4 SV=1: MFS_3 [Gemmataceae bacterium]|nr:Permease of the major facilitator superfamily OS=Phenylobacterium zucineum (strain HLK1) GN=PHZ_c2880 PE=4 SV=1: MFS_3 [Gemmataceae bacterium]VTT99601.1 Permease of the major facilitator superfamily OS=Phenylobacterium zucineum (strain HLK1) GN=PHZ_c2880 PE=4 SV=1: MFS_3 [Gemmataceae bacterium]